MSINPPLKDDCPECGVNDWWRSKKWKKKRCFKCGYITDYSPTEEAGLTPLQCFLYTIGN